MLPETPDEPRVAAWNRRVDWAAHGARAGVPRRLRLVGARPHDPAGRSRPPGGAAHRHMGGVRPRLPHPDRTGPPSRPLRLRHLPDLAILLLPMFRPLRVLRLITVITVLHRQLR